MKILAVLGACCAAAILMFGAGAAGAAPVSASTGYIISLAGINVADLTVSLEDDGQRYGLDLRANVSGLGQIVASGTAEINSAGRSGAGLAPERFLLRTVAGGESFEVRVGFRDGNTDEFVVTPPLLDTADRVPLERAHLTGVTDMLSAFVIKGGTLDASLCERQLRIFTGIERFDVALSFARTEDATSPRTGYQGPVVLCNVRYTPISGHFESSEITRYLANSPRVLIWYAPLGDTGYFIPYRVLMGTGFGDLSMVLTHLSF